MPPRAPTRLVAALRRVRFLARAELLHVRRDRATMAQIVALPLLQLLVLASAATFQIRDTPTYVVDLDRTPASRGLVARFAASGHFRLLGGASSPDLADEALLRGQATLVLTIPDGFEAGVVRTGRAPVQLSVNAEKGSAAGIVQAYAAQILVAYGHALTADAVPGAPAGRATSPDAPPTRGAPRIDVRVRGWYNPTLDYQHYMVPGILVALVTMVGTLLTAQNIVREKEIGTLEQLNVTPITKGQFIAAKLLPYWGLGMLNLALGLGVGWLVFDIPMRGSLALLFAAAAVYLVAALAIGLWISTVVETQQQAMFVAFFILMIYLLMSGLLTPLDSMPRWARLAAELNPVRHFVAVSRAVLVKGAGPAEVARPIGILAVYGAVVLGLAVRQYSKRTR